MLPHAICALALGLASVRGADLVFVEKSEWEVVSRDHQFAEGMAWDAAGDFYFTDVPRAQLFRVDRVSGNKTLIDGATGRANGIAFGPDGRVYGCASGDRRIYAWDIATARKVAVTEGTLSNDIVVLRDGTIFYTEPAAMLVWRLAAGTFAREVGAQLPWKPNGIAVSSDQRTLLVAEFDSNTIHGFPLGADVRVSGPARPAFLPAVPADGMGRLDGMEVLPDGRLLVGTALGTQIVPPASGSPATLPLIVVPSPQGRPRCNYVRLSPDGAWMYTAYAADLLRRKVAPGFGGAAR